MSAPRKPCKLEGCDYPKMAGKHFCGWHWLKRQPITEQIRYADARRARVTGEPRPRVPKSEWPDGERWCADCQTFVPLFYATGSRCKACASAASHAQRIEKTYGITSADYDALLELQGGVCYVCRRKSISKRLAVDHDHKTGEVRGLLCPDNERGCNHAVLGSLENSIDGALAAARRVVEYLEHTPFERLREGQGAPVAAPDTRGWPDAGPPPY